LFTNALWNATTVPVFSTDYEANILDGQKLHKIAAGFVYFESNTFTVNSVPLDEGHLRILSFEMPISYHQYLPIIPNIDFMTGLTLVPRYRLSGRVVALGAVHENENYTLGMGPLYGFSFSAPDLLEFYLLAGLTADLPVSGKITYPDKSTSNKYPTGFNVSIKIGVSYRIEMILVRLEYMFSFRCEAAFDPSTVIPEYFDFISSHSIVLRTGFVF
jgi:hypothetical protein